MWRLTPPYLITETKLKEYIKRRQKDNKMTIKIRMRGKSKGGIAEVKALIKHPMESGVRMNKKTGKPYPAKYIDMVEILVNGTKAVDAQWSGAVSANPYMAVKVKANAGDEVSVNLTDNTGDKGSSSIKLK